MEKLPNETWRQFAERVSRSYGLEVPVMEAFESYLEAGDTEAEAARCALYDWDL